MSFKVNPFNFRVGYHKNWKNTSSIYSNNKILSKNVAIEQCIRQVLYEKDIYVIDCFVHHEINNNWIVFFSYFNFYKFKIHSLKKSSKFIFINKFSFYRSSLRKRGKKKILKSFFLNRYLLKREKKKKIYVKITTNNIKISVFY